MAPSARRRHSRPSRKSLEQSVAEALQLGHNYVGTEHLLLALFADPEGLAARILSELGATRDDARRRVVAHLIGTRQR